MCKFAILACVLVLVSTEEPHTTDSSITNPTTELCGGQSEIALTMSSSTMTVTLAPVDHNSICKVRVTAPPTHAIYMQFVEASPEVKRALVRNISVNHPPCVMSIFLPENPRVPVWKGDVCSDNALTEVDLLTSDFKIIWNPPANPAFTRGRKFVLTAVGQGQVCKEPGQHTCMRLGWDPMMCVADSLLCNGFPNCPKSSTASDEDEKLCKKSFFAPSSLEQLAVELFKKWKPPELNNKWLQEKLDHLTTTPRPRKTFISWREWRDNAKTEAAPTTSTTESSPKKPPRATDSISQVLSKYGPWGYLMLGMLICGTVLMFCGLWECCFRKPKSEVDAPVSQTQPTTVLIINPQEEAAPTPPNYDDLDRPPSYSILFPNYKVNQNPSDSGRSSCEENSCERIEEDSRDSSERRREDNAQSDET